MTLELTLAGAALVVALGALALAGLVMRQNADTTDEIRRHRRAHAKVHGTPDPDRRQRDTGPPAGQPDRRRAPTPPRVVPSRHAADEPTVEHPAPTTVIPRQTPPGGTR